MKWFKHYSNTTDSVALAELERKFGFEGLGRYWRFLEFLTQRFDGTDCHFSFPREVLRSLFRHRSWNDLQSFADQLTIIPGLNVERSGNVYEIKAPILLELLDRDFKNARKKRVVHAHKILDKELDKELISKTNNSKNENDSHLDSVKSFETQFSDFYQAVKKWSKDQKIRLNHKQISEVVRIFETAEDFGNWVGSVESTKTFLSLSGNKKTGYLAKAILNEISGGEKC